MRRKLISTTELLMPLWKFMPSAMVSWMSTPVMRRESKGPSSHMPHF